MSRDFNGTSQYLTADTPLTTPYPMSMHCWFKISAGVTTFHTLMAVSDLASSDDYIRFQARIGLYLRLQQADNLNASVLVATSTAPAADTWHSAGLYVASTTSRGVLLDGGGKATNIASTNAPTASKLLVGVLERSGGRIEYADGVIAHPAVWNVVLTDAEFASLAAGLSPLKVRPESLVFYAPHLGRDATEIDIIGARNLTVTGAVASADEPRLIRPRAPVRAFRAPEPLSLGIDPGALTVAGQGATFVANQTVETNGQLQLSGGTAAAESELATSGASLTIGGTELDLAISAPVPDTGTAAVHAGRRASRRYWVEIDGQVVYVNTPAEAAQLLRQFEERAPREAERQADELVARRTASVRSLGQVKPVRLAPPTLRTNLPESEALREARALLGNLYQDAARRATAALEAERRRWLQDQDDAQTLIALGDL